MALGDRGGDVLRLPAVALRRHDHAARDHVGGGRAVLDSHDVEGGVDSGRGARPGDHFPVVDEQDFGVDIGAGILAGQAVGVHPVGCRATAFEHPGLRENECSAADAEHPCAAGLRAADDVEVPLVDVADRLSGDGDEVRVGGDGQVVADDHVEAEARADGPRVGGGDGEVEGGGAAVAAVDPEDLADDSEFEGRDARNGEQDHFLEHDASWRDFDELWQSCHSRQFFAIRRFSAMTTTLLILLGASSAVAVIATLVATVRDGYRRVPARPRD